MSDKEPPLIPNPGGKPFGAEIIDLGDFRVKHGMARYPTGRCEHRSVTYNREERRVWCRDCERTIDGFDAFMLFVNRFDTMMRAARSRLEKADAALKAVLTRRVAKDLDRTWASGMAPCCPHCRKALLPEDLASVSTVNMEWERKVRDRRARTDTSGGSDAP